MKDIWWLDNEGHINHAMDKDNGDYYFEKNREIGNYFESEMEAEKAVKKLKAWKRLKDKGFEFCKYSALAYGEIDFRIPDFESWDNSDNEQVKHDLDLLFGGEE